jgi:hypothetical protein
MILIPEREPQIDPCSYNGCKIYVCVLYMDEDTTVRMLKEVLTKLHDIDTRLCIVEKSINGIQNSTTNMDRHISFVEHVYHTIKTPLNFVLTHIPQIQYTHTTNIAWIDSNEEW